MRMLWTIVPVLLASVLAAQDTSRQQDTYTYDLNGNKVAVGNSGRTQSGSRETQTERMQSISGRTVPLETVQEKVLSEGPNGKVVERIIQLYDQTGNPGPQEKIRIEEKKNSSGGMTVKRTVYRTDLNGRYALAERSTSQSRQSGDKLTSSTTTETPTINGSLEITEKQSLVETNRKDGSSRDLTTYRKNQGGSFYEAARETTEVVKQDNKETTTTTVFNATNSGRLAFASQKVSNLEKHPDGSETTLIDVYGAAPMGRSIGNNSGEAHLREQQLIERKKGSDGSVVETFSLRRASLANSNRFSDFELISEVVCKGNCEEDRAEPGGEEENTEQAAKQ